MTELTTLDNNTHKHLKVAGNAPMELAIQSHVLNLNVAEVAMAVSNFPVFLSKNTQTGQWAISALASFKQGQSLFVENGAWTATYQPTSIQTHPFYLVQSQQDPEKFSVGFDSRSKALSETDGIELYAEDGRPSDQLQKVTALLEADIQNSAQTYHFAQKLEALGLIKAIDIVVSYSDGTDQTLKGLYTLNEDKIKMLNSETLVELNNNGYLTVIHAMLTSIYQLNSLIKKQSGHNDGKSDGQNVTQIKLEVAKGAQVE